MALAAVDEEAAAAIGDVLSLATDFDAKTLVLAGGDFATSVLLTTLATADKGTVGLLPKISPNQRHSQCKTITRNVVALTAHVESGKKNTPCNYISILARMQSLIKKQAISNTHSTSQEVQHFTTST